ncbi:MAG: hypothetical protein KDB82_13890 [Planctomycetes bacterium]|nr:hypothetical protein [Planctomycetota bacterium]
MGVLYQVAPLNDEIRPWLDDFEIDHGSLPDGRHPTGEIVAAAVLALARDDIEENAGEEGVQYAIGMANVEGETGDWALCEVRAGSPTSISFEKGSPELNATIVKEIARHCGPMVLIPDTGEAPAVITADTDITELIANWEHTRSR